MCTVSISFQCMFENAFLKDFIIMFEFQCLSNTLFILLTLKAPITTAADNIHKSFFNVLQRKQRLDISCESSARQRIHIKHQALFSSKDKSKEKL